MDMEGRGREGEEDSVGSNEVAAVKWWGWKGMNRGEWNGGDGMGGDKGDRDGEKGATLRYILLEDWLISRGLGLYGRSIVITPQLLRCSDCTG